MTFVYGIFLAAYFITLLALRNGFKKLPTFNFIDSMEETTFSVLVPFRNEIENISQLLQSIENLEYPKHLFEVIFIDDASEDATAQKIHVFKKNTSSIQISLLKNIRVSKSPKKDALTFAISKAKYNWIVTTDADCTVPPTWLSFLDAFIQKENPKLVCGTVEYEVENNFISKFQQLDGFSLQTVGMGSFGLRKPLLCNGANLAYEKEAFFTVNGFTGNDHLASGDDIFMLEKMKVYFPDSIFFLKNRLFTVTTKCQKTWHQLIMQRIRWASKTSKQKNMLSKIIGMLVFCINFLIIIGLVLLPYSKDFFVPFICFILLKLLFDFWFLKLYHHYFKKPFNFTVFIVSAFIYPLIITLVFIGSLRGSYYWKGRKF